MTIINENTLAISTFLELKNILESENKYTYVYLENDIKLKNGIKIISTKSIITIDGTYNNTIHTIEDKKSLNASDTISALSNYSKSYC